MRLLGESKPGIDLGKLEMIGAADSELTGIITLLHQLTSEHGQRVSSGVVASGGSGGGVAVAGAVAGGGGRTTGRLGGGGSGGGMGGYNDILMVQALSTISALNAHRSRRISALQSAFPPIHYAILGLLSVSITVGKRPQSCGPARGVLRGIPSTPPPSSLSPPTHYRHAF